MHIQRAAWTATCCALICTVALAQGSNLEELWRRGLFSEVRETVAARLADGEDSRAFLTEAARASYESGDYETAAELYLKLANLSALDPDEYREAKEMQWKSLHMDGGESASAPWVIGARAEVSRLLDEVALAKSQRRQLALELQWILESLLDRGFKAPEELTTNYPNSEIALRITWLQAQRLSDISDDGKRLAAAREFLKTHPGSQWRHLAYRQILYSTWRLRNHEQLKAAANAYLKEYPSSPESHGAVSRYYLDADIEHAAGIAAAQRSVELYETSLFLDGDESDLAEVNERTRGQRPAPAWETPADRQQFLEYLGSRFNLARWLVKSDKFSDAMGVVLPVLAIKPFTLEEELSLAPFYVVAGQASMGRGDEEEAYRYFMGALVEGDSSGRYTLQAEQELAKLANDITASEAQQIRGRFMPPELSDITIPQFTDVTVPAGLQSVPSRRVAWGDINGDGYAELLVDGSRLFWNDNAEQLPETTKGIGLSGEFTGGLFADVENDGDLDIFSFGEGMRGDKLWRNEAARFTDITNLAGTIGDNQRNEAAVWLDYDQDDDIDLFLPAFDRSIGEFGRSEGRLDMLYRNLGQGVFERLSSTLAGLSPDWTVPSTARGASTADIEGDGSLELYVANSVHVENLLWQEREAGFRNVARLLGAAGHSENQMWGNSAGCDFGDVNNDGVLDLFCANTSSDETVDSDRSQLLIAEPASFGFEYVDRRNAYGIKATATPCEPVFADFNSDGNLDLLLTNSYSGRRANLYVGNGSGKLTDATFLAGLRAYDGWGAATADFDRDGDLDIAIASPSGLRLLRNDTATASWLQVDCRPASGAASAIGARVILEQGGQQQVREIQSGKGTGNGNEMVAHFGLGRQRGGGTVRVTFPSGRVVLHSLTGINQRIVVREADIEPATTSAEAALGSPVTRESETGNDRWLRQGEPRLLQR